MKKILLICELFYPSNAVGAVRPTKIAKYLTELGCEVDVFTKHPVEDAQSSKLFHRLYSYGPKAEAPAQKNSAQASQQPKKRSALYKKLYSLYSITKKILQAKATVWQLERLLNGELSTKQYDAVISSFGPLSALLCGLHYKKKNPAVKWICDFRDPVVVDEVPKLFHPYYRYLQNKACRKADVITTVSNGYFQRICADQYRSKSHMIPNGYDVEDRITLENDRSSNEKLTLAYAGILYSGKRDLRPLLKAIRELIDEGSIDENKVSIQYAGSDFMPLAEQANAYDLEKITVNHGQMRREDCLAFQAAADMLILATWNDKKEIGVFPGKFLEYMLMQKPIVALVAGALPNSEVKAVMEEGIFGVTYEQANDKQDFSLLKAYVKRQYDAFISCGLVQFTPNTEVLDRYDWNTLIQRIYKLI